MEYQLGRVGWKNLGELKLPLRVLFWWVSITALRSRQPGEAGMSLGELLGAAGVIPYLCLAPARRAVACLSSSLVCIVRVFIVPRHFCEGVGKAEKRAKYLGV